MVWRLPYIQEHSTSMSTEVGMHSAHTGSDDLLEVTDYLLNLEKEYIYNLGIVLGLSRKQVKQLEDSKSFWMMWWMHGC